MRRNTLIVVIVSVVAVITIPSSIYYLTGSDEPPKRRLVVSTTTSLFDTGLLDEVEDRFEEEHQADINFISAGTGLAIEHAEKGDADLILVHAPSKELAFMDGGYGVCRKIIAYNFFTIVGPKDDPAKINGLSPLEALTEIVKRGRAEESIWVSRGDDSGTNIKEKELWTAAGYDWQELRNENWYRESGTGMGKTLQIAEEYMAYTLADMGTFLKYRIDELITLEVLVDEEKELLNVYSAIVVNPEIHTETNFDDAIDLIKYLTSDDGQAIIGDYGVKTHERNLFFPAVELLKHKTDPTLTEWIEDFAFFDGSECPPEYRADQTELYE